MSPRELPPISPRGELRTQGPPDPHEFESARQARKSDFRIGHAAGRLTIAALTLFDGLPAFFERRQVPAGTVRADHPEAPLGGVERQRSSDRECLDFLIRAKGAMTVQARGVH